MGKQTDQATVTITEERWSGKRKKERREFRTRIEREDVGE